MTWTLGSLPLHPLFVHLTTVAVPTAALIGLAVALWPAARARLGLAAPLIGLVALVSTPLATSSGESLERQVPHTAALEHHTQLGDTLIWFVLPLFALLALHWALERWFPAARRRSAAADPVRGSHVDAAARPGWARAAAVIVPILLVVVSIAALVDVVLIGHAGAVAVWKN